VDARRPLYITPARVSLKPLVRLAVRVLGPGPLRLKMVKFSHELDSELPLQSYRKAA
jgi:hypothetical protein